MPFSLLGNPNLARIIFARRNVQPPTQLYVTKDDYLSVTLLSPGVQWNPCYIRLRLLNAFGEVKHMQHRQGQPYWNSESIARYQLDEGQLLGVEVTPQDTRADRGGIYAVVELTRTALEQGGEHAILAADYCSRRHPVGWPTSRPVSPQEGPGRDVFFEIGSPGSGQQVQVTMPLYARWKIKGITGRLTTGAAVGNRHVALIVREDSGMQWSLGRAVAEQPASTTWFYSFEPSTGAYGPTSANICCVPFAADVWLRSNYLVRISAVGLNPGDTFADSQWWIEQAVRQ